MNYYQNNLNKALKATSAGEIFIVKKEHITEDFLEQLKKDYPIKVESASSISEGSYYVIRKVD